MNPGGTCQYQIELISVDYISRIQERPRSVKKKRQ